MGEGLRHHATKVTQVIPVTRQAASKHLQLLESAGLVTSARRGRERVWTVQTEPLARASDYLAAQKIIMAQAYEIPFHVNEDLLTYASSISGIEYEGGGDTFFYQAH